MRDRAQFTLPEQSVNGAGHEPGEIDLKAPYATFEAV